MQEIADGAVRAATRASTVRFHVRATFTARLDEARLNGPTPVPAARLRALAARPLRIVLDGARSRDAVTATVFVEAAGVSHTYAVRSVGGRLYLGLREGWRVLPFTLGSLFQSESFGALVPEELCADHGGGEGCARVSLEPALAAGRFGRLVRGDVRAGPELAGTPTWEVSGRLDAGQLARLRTGTSPERADVRALYEEALRSLEPYEQHGHISIVVERESGLPRRVSFSYQLPPPALAQHLRGDAAATPVVERAATIDVELDGWNEPLDVTPPEGATAASGAMLEPLFDGIFVALPTFF